MQPTHLPSQEAAFVVPTRILVATDLDDIGYLLPHALAQAKASGARITLVHADEPIRAFPMEAGYAPYAEPFDVDRDVRAELEKIAHSLELQGIVCDAVCACGFAADVIRETIKTTGATLLIMGSHGRGKWEQLALGSVANELLGSVSIPVFVVGPHAAANAGQATPRNILHPVSLAGDYRKSLDVALALAASYKAKLTLLHVLDRAIEDDINPARTLAWTETALLSLVPTSWASGNYVHAQAAYGSFVQKTLEAATKTNADWIVLGVEGGHSHRPFKNSKGYSLVVSAKCCVLIVRHDAQQVVEVGPGEVALSAAIA